MGPLPAFLDPGPAVAAAALAAYGFVDRQCIIAMNEGIPYNMHQADRECS